MKVLLRKSTTLLEVTAIALTGPARYGAMPVAGEARNARPEESEGALREGAQEGAAVVGENASDHRRGEEGGPKGDERDERARCRILSKRSALASVTPSAPRAPWRCASRLDPGCCSSTALRRYFVRG